MRSLLRSILGFLSRRIIKKYSPIVVGVTGSVGKTVAKEVIADYLSSSLTVRRSFANLNTEFGAPLAVIGLNKPNWIIAVIKGLWLLCCSAKYPQVLVVEMGADKPGDISYLKSIIPVSIGVVTRIGEYPSHLENYPSRADLIKEKLKIRGRMLIVNGDDPDLVGDLKYGFNQGNDIVISDFNQTPTGVSFKVDGQFFDLSNCYGRSWAYAVGSAVAVARCLGAFRGEVNNNLPAGRLGIKKGKNNSLVIDDTYNSSPEGVRMALEVLASLPAKRRVAILGDMKELGDRSLEAHQKIKKEAEQIADLVLVYGPEFGSSEVEFQPQEGDVVLVKGSRSMKMERIVEEICQ